MSTVYRRFLPLALLGGLLLVPAAPLGAQEMTFGAEEALDLGASSNASKFLDDGLRLYDAKDYAGSSLELYKVVAAKDPESQRFRPKAEYSLGKALYRMGFLQSSLGYFNKIAEAGKEHKYHRATLKWLYLIHRSLGDPAILEKIAVYDVADYPENYRADIAFLVGQYHYRRGNLDDALRSLGAIPRGNPDYGKAKYLEGILWVRKNQAQPAIEAFKEILRVVTDDRRSVDDADKLEYMAWLSMARIFYATGQYDLSIKYYNKVPQTSELWLEALFEESWSHYQQNNFEKSLGNLHTLNSPFFDNAYFPETMILQSVIYFTNCKYDLTRKTVEQFLLTYPELEKQIETYLQRYAEPSQFWDFLVKLNTEGGRFNSKLQQIFNVAFDDKNLVKSHRYIKQLDAESQRLGTVQGTWGRSELAEALLGDIQVVRSMAVHEAGRYAMSLLERVKRDLQELKSQALKIKFEVANAEVGRLENKIKDELFVETNAAPRGDITATDDEHIYWPFQGEYWKDELGSYYYYIRSECGR
ncbi:MAG: tetratricopeptide repeat protein [Myxococcota bacterium]|nr:tetratricopeptide repeat protein [Myxococcota bacterium]